MQRQRVLERAGWVFWRCFASTFLRRRQPMIDELLKTLQLLGIEPIGADAAERAPETRTHQAHTEQVEGNGWRDALEGSSEASGETLDGAA